jgi:hypothetical protein
MTYTLGSSAADHALGNDLQIACGIYIAIILTIMLLGWLRRRRRI